MQHLVLRVSNLQLYYKCIQLVDIFQFSNIYTTTAKIKEFLLDRDLQAECATWVTEPGSELPPLEKLVSIYCAFKIPYCTVRDVCRQMETAGLSVDPRAAVTFGGMLSLSP